MISVQKDYMKKFGLIILGVLMACGIGVLADETADNELLYQTISQDGYRYYFVKDYLHGNRIAAWITGIESSVVDSAAMNGGVLKLPDSLLYNNTSYDIIEVSIEMNKYNPDLNGIYTLILPSKAETVEYLSANSTDLKIIDCGDSLAVIKESFFQCSSLEEIKWSAAMVEIEDGSFWKSGLKTLQLPDSLIYLDLYSFYENEQLEELDLNKVERIETNSFTRCSSLKRLVIPPSVKYIGYESFREMNSLEEIVFQDSSDDLKIGPCVFSQCTNLKRIYMERSVPPSAYDVYDCGDYDRGDKEITEEIPKIVFGQISSECRHCSEPLDPTKVKLYVPIGTAEAYRNSVTWGAFTDIEEYDVSGMAETELRPDWKLYDNLNIKAGAIELTNLNGNAVSVYGIDGRLINSSVATGTWTVDVPHGVYLVKVDSTTAKVMVK
jgi:hypothetical protein